MLLNEKTLRAHRSVGSAFSEIYFIFCNKIRLSITEKIPQIRNKCMEPSTKAEEKFPQISKPFHATLLQYSCATATIKALKTFQSKNMVLLSNRRPLKTSCNNNTMHNLQKKVAWLTPTTITTHLKKRFETSF